jgi:ATP-dependent Clp protease ATP-binding subunit ClpA
VQELGRDATLEILRGLAHRAGEKDGIAVDEAALEGVVGLSTRFMRNRYLPDKAIDIFQHALARARVSESQVIGVPEIHEVVRRMVNVPVDGQELTARLDALEEALPARGGVDPATAHQLVQRLRVTMRSMDLHPSRPNLVVLATGAGDGPIALARLISERVFGAEAPVIEQDMSILQHPSDVSRLVGTAPGYVGFDEPLQLHLELAQRPWSVVLFRGADLAHPAVQAVLAQALQKGYLLASSGKKVYLSDTVCVLTVASRDTARARAIGFVPSDRPAGVADGDGREALGGELGALVDVICRVTREVRVELSWVVENLLEPMARHYRQECNVKVSWEDDIPGWIASEGSKGGGDPRALENWFEATVVPLVVAAVGDREVVREVRLHMDGGALQAVSCEASLASGSSDPGAN